MSKLSEIILNLHTSNHTSGTRFIFAGSNSSGVAYLQQQPGSSSTILESTLTYLRSSTIDYINQNLQKESKITSFTSSESALELSRASLARGKKLLTIESKNFIELSESINKLYGVGISAALASIPIKKGDHRCHVAISTDNKEKIYSIVLNKGKRTREEEEKFCGIFVVAICAIESGIFLNSCEEFLKIYTDYGSGDVLTTNFTVLSSPIEQLLKKEITSVLYLPITSKIFGQIYATNVPIMELDKYGNKPTILIESGSFNPLHKGHIHCLMNTAKDISNCQPIFELSISNIDKSSLKLDEIIKRVQQFSNHHLVITNAPTYLDKDKLFHGASYVLGIDTAIRLVDSKYTNNDSSLMMTNTNFYIYSRVAKDGGPWHPEEEVTLSKIKEIEHMFVEIIGNEHKSESSSKLRLTLV